MSLSFGALFNIIKGFFRIAPNPCGACLICVVKAFGILSPYVYTAPAFPRALPSICGN